MHPDDRHDRQRFLQLLEKLEASLQVLPDKPRETPESTLRALWHTAAGEPLSIPRALDTPLPALDADAARHLEELLEQRLGGKPLAYITGHQHFAGVDLLVSPAALIPRAETELLARTAIGLATGMARESSKPCVIDVCTGSGNVALAIAAAVPEATVHAADMDPEAVALARLNARQLRLQERVHLYCGDLLQPFDSADFLARTDLLTCNPPYISSAKLGHMHREIVAHEPASAFDGGPLGVSLLMRLLTEAPRMLRPGGWLVFEVGMGQGPALLRKMGRNPAWEEVRAIHDEADAIRGLMAQRGRGANP